MTVALSTGLYRQLGVLNHGCGNECSSAWNRGSGNKLSFRKGQGSRKLVYHDDDGLSMQQDGLRLLIGLGRAVSISTDFKGKESKNADLYRQNC